MATTGSKQKKKGAEELTFSFNGGGTGRGEAAVRTQGRPALLVSAPVPLKNKIYDLTTAVIF